ncbi:MAG: universal stress protein [Gemmatimonadota bacterium]|nr:universal stress protein [Gemmatimonadota bacterium]
MPPRLETVLIGVDLTAPSLAGAKWAATTFAPEARLVLAHAVETSPLRRFLPVRDAKRKESEVRAEAKKRLEALRDEVGAERCRIVVAEGSPGNRLSELAREEEADLIVVGAHREGMAGGLIGSIVSTVLGSATMPVLIAHAPPAGRPKQVLVAIDESPVRSEVLAWATLLAEAFEDMTGEVLSAVQPPGVSVNTTLFSSEEEYRKTRDQIVERTRKWVRGRADNAGLDGDRFAAGAVYGRPELEIALAAERIEADLIVLGTRGHTHGHALVLGSVSRRVVEASTCPVLIVPPNEPR